MSNWRKKADDEWSRVIRQVGKCEICKVPGIKGKKKGWVNLDAHHIITRGHTGYRHDLSNGICLCKGCHKFKPWAPHQDHTQFIAILKSSRPGQYVWYLSNVVVVEKEIAGAIVKTYRPIECRPELTSKRAYEMLKTM